ncbi:acetyltransferase (GNAT) family protein [Thermosporothrix hazakensis]|jgi:GNAT superfamily N-acetyltransferase|uniref:Acetyltransferase (GNAT) family protein n=1 Tax=Thermosporothrix hazakensis TaxID=644383 RepID=A0A326U9U4_THEHA|nr:GNAT family N-acetyltransferase [Thermosporothrix hazakensis]PZW32861.1 acetyltransferase (GNAT) family protein [Thermosporothrix hazakensis]GCE48892.1 hypothetical protein KTH_37610 [Thermosporothrix hazakensis]
MILKQLVDIHTEHIPQLQLLINSHLGTLVPGWALPVSFIASRLERDPWQIVLDPWVQERRTLGVLVQDRVVAAAHLLRYRDDETVPESYRNVGDVAWLLFWPGAADAARMLLDAAHQQMEAWRVRFCYAWGQGLPIGPFAGIPDVWGHIEALFRGAGYQGGEDHDTNLILYAGPVGVYDADPDVRREVGRIEGTCFQMVKEEQVIGHCEFISDLSRGGLLPALRGWGELAEIEISEQWRNQGLGARLLQTALVWHRLGGGQRVIIATTWNEHAAGSGRFYRRFGLHLLAQTRVGWKRG